MVPGVPLKVNLIDKLSGWTGLVLLLVFFLLITTSIKPIRQRLFEVFYFIHHLFILCTVFLFIHGDNKRASKYLSGPIALYCADRLYRNLRTAFAKSPIRAVIQHPSGVYEIQLDKKIIGHRPGQYVRLYCPSVSLLQWHPITISSAPEEELLTLHIRLAGGWTTSLAQRLGCSFESDARQSTVQKVVALSGGLKAMALRRFCHSAVINVSPAPLLDIPYHPLRHDPTTVPMYSQAGGNSSYISIDMVAKGGSTAMRGSLAIADDDGKLKPTVSVVGNRLEEVAESPSSAQIENGNVVIKMGAELPVIFIDGPYSGPAEHFFDYEVGVLIAAGIGVTPAAAVLRSVYFKWLQGRDQLPSKKVYVFWVYRDIDTIEWFKDLLIALEEEGLGSIVEVRTFFTGQVPESHTPQLAPAEDRFGKQVITTSIGTKSYIGRPDFGDIFESIGALHPDTRVGTFLCGPKPMVRKVRREAHRWDARLRKSSNTTMDFHSEVF
ncbi:NADPH oxidase 3 [Coemansia furcata]|nr:NADPH oxidase 3 [Coemansia furcata]